MQPLKQLSQAPENLADDKHYLFSLTDLRYPCDVPFFSPQTVANTVAKESFWAYLTNLIGVECDAVIQSLKQPSASIKFKM